MATFGVEQKLQTILQNLYNYTQEINEYIGLYDDLSHLELKICVAIKMSADQ